MKLDFVGPPKHPTGVKMFFQKMPPEKYQGPPRCKEGVCFSRPPPYAECVIHYPV